MQAPPVQVGPVGPSGASDKNEMMKLLLALNDGVRSLGKRFDDY